MSRAGSQNNDEDDEEDEYDDSEVKFWMIQRLPKFGGAIGEDPVTHVKKFHSICCRIKPKEESLERFKLKIFLFSLTDSAKSWYYSSSADCESDYLDLRARFLKKFSPPSFQFEIREKISTIEQFPGETLYEYYLRFDDLQGSCPHHGLTDLFLLKSFLDGMNPLECAMLDAAAGGSVMDLHIYDIWDLIDDMAERSRRGQMHKTDDNAQLVEAVSVQIMADITCNTYVTILPAKVPNPRGDISTITVIEKSGAEKDKNDSESVSIASDGDIISTLMSEADAPITSTADATRTDAQSKIDPMLPFFMQVIAPEDHVIDNDKVEDELEANHEPEKPMAEQLLVMSQAAPPEKCKDPGAFTVTRDVDSYVLQMGEARDNSPPASILGRPLLLAIRTKVDMGTHLLSLASGKTSDFHIHEDSDRPCMRKRPRFSTFGWKPGWRDTRAPLDEGYEQQKGVAKFDLTRPWDPNL